MIHAALLGVITVLIIEMLLWHGEKRTDVGGGLEGEDRVIYSCGNNCA